MGAAVIRVPIPARREDPCWIHRKATPITRGWGPHLCPAPVGRQGHEGEAGLQWGQGREGRAGVGQG